MLEQRKRIDHFPIYKDSATSAAPKESSMFGRPHSPPHSPRHHHHSPPPHHHSPPPPDHHHGPLTTIALRHPTIIMHLLLTTTAHPRQATADPLPRTAGKLGDT
ncbi:hypothetical protein F444_12411 [Phytophthora nicotianae P1976]|uniref:Uncharacterized protein n=1 Tax=Phytophthora nicotianae P1976 TaxID=1317066 RepID=A0A080ZX80_PHYNI|nr:hypothetical protein F444_12411 [Phytophthora nicotianae P1976]